MLLVTKNKYAYLFCPIICVKSHYRLDVTFKSKMTKWPVCFVVFVCLYFFLKWDCIFSF